ncbi:GNAT family N-acetyltransferase [Tumebacillus lipolyticus]|uniref:GNAT family N-acetyltransferase n=1 Tax=Tumebacillus lipolyticus TaxID=1280370 RepID=A0ABW4ZSP2_9BACL
MKLQGDRLYIRKTQVSDAEELLAHHLRNKELFDLYRPLRSEDDFTLEAMRGKLERQHQEWEQDKSYAFHVFLNETDAFIGSVDLMFVQRGPGQRALLGYEMDQAHHGKGLMSEAVRLCLKYGFEHAELHRIEAGVMPQNEGSNRLLEKLGFHKEGLFRKNVKINGQWEDHYIWAMLDTDWSNRSN